MFKLNMYFICDNLFFLMYFWCDKKYQTAWAEAKNLNSISLIFRANLKQKKIKHNKPLKPEPKAAAQNSRSTTPPFASKPGGLILSVRRRLNSSTAVRLRMCVRARVKVVHLEISVSKAT